MYARKAVWWPPCCGLKQGPSELKVWAATACTEVQRLCSLCCNRLTSRADQCFTSFYFHIGTKPHIWFLLPGESHIQLHLVQNTAFYPPVALIQAYSGFEPGFPTPQASALATRLRNMSLSLIIPFSHKGSDQLYSHPLGIRHRGFWTSHLQVAVALSFILQRTLKIPVLYRTKGIWDNNFLTQEATWLAPCSKVPLWHYI